MGTVYAQFNWGTRNTFQPAQFGNVASLVNVIAPAMIMGGAVLFLAMLIMAAFDVITAAGSSEKIAKAQKTAMFSLFGLVIIICSFLIVRVIGVVFNIQNELKPLGF